MKRYYVTIGVLSLPLLLVLALTRVSAQATPYVTGEEPLQDRYPSALQASVVITVCPASVGICPYADIQAAVDAAGDGDLIKVAAGTYTSAQGRLAPSSYPHPPPSGIITQVVYVSKTVTIRGGYTTTSNFAAPPDPVANLTVLDAQGQGRVLFITGDVSPTIEGLHITGGDAAGLGGCDILPEEDAGGAVYIITATVTIGNNQVFANTGRCSGGALYLYRSVAALSGNIISGNAARCFGGGLALSSSNATFSDNTVSANAAKYGGGLYLDFYSTATLRGNTITANSADDRGGGLYLSFYSTATLSSNTISANTANDGGGGLYLSSYSTATLSSNTISANTATAGAGGGLSLSHSNATLVNNVIADNTGGGLYVYCSSLHLLHTTIARNTGGDGSGIYATNWSGLYNNMWVTNTILVSQTVGIYLTSGDTARLESTLWGGNAGNWDGEGTIIHNNDYTGNPAFVNPGAGDYHISPASAARDAGIDAGVTEDIDGHPRPIGPGFDLGADEYTGVDLSPSSKNASPEEARAGDVVTFTIVLFNNGIWNASDTTLYDSIPTSTTYISGSARATSGVLTDAGGIRWTGTVTPSETITIAFQVVVGEEVFIKNTAIVTDEYGAVLNLVAWVNPQRLYLPLMLRGS